MACTNCGGGTAIAGYTVCFESGDGDDTVMDLVLCSECAAEFRAERGIEVEQNRPGGDRRER